MRIAPIPYLFIVHVFIDVDDFVIEEPGVDDVLEAVVRSLAS